MNNHIRFLLLFAVICLSSSVTAQFKFSDKEVTKVVYSTSYNDRTDPNQNPIWVFADSGNALITNRDQMNNTAAFPFEMTLIHSNISSYAQYAFLKEGSCIAMLDSQSINKQNWELLSDTKDILGYRCKKARTSINSNTIELWYTNELQVKGAPTT